MERAGQAPAKRNKSHEDEYDVLTGKDNVSVTKTATKGSPAKPKTAAERRARVARILAILDRRTRTPHARSFTATRGSCWYLPSLSAVHQQAGERVTPGLFRKYPTIEDFAHASPAELENDIRSTGFFRNKTKSLIGAARTILGEFGGKVPRTIEG